MSKRSRLLESIATIIGDYRADEIDPLTPEHVEKWVKQFDKAVQEPMLAELDHVLDRTYLSRKAVERFLTIVVKKKELAGADPRSFWKHVRFLDIQERGNSQKEMLGMFDTILQKKTGLKLQECGHDPLTFLYLDDAIFSGNHVLKDLSRWIESEAPKKADVHIVVMAIHSGGRLWSRFKLEKKAHDVGKSVEFTWWPSLTLPKFRPCINDGANLYYAIRLYRPSFTLEEFRPYINASEVLSPSRLPKDKRTRAYRKMLEGPPEPQPPILRESGKMGNNRVFSSEERRDLLEQQFLRAGLRIREKLPGLPETYRPLGGSALKTLGIGSLLVTFRNCPNNCPLAFWVGDPWYPLFPRKANW